MHTTDEEYRLASVLLAGGKGQRMGGLEKGLQNYRGRPMIEWALDSVKTLIDDVVISCNQNKMVYLDRGFPVCSDLLPIDRGPLAGFESAMHYFGARFSHLLVLPCDTPSIKQEHLTALISASMANPENIVVLKSAEGTEYLHAVIPMIYASSLSRYLDRGDRAVKRWYSNLPVTVVPINDSLTNINYLEQLSESAA